MRKLLTAPVLLAMVAGCATTDTDTVEDLGTDVDTDEGWLALLDEPTAFRFTDLDIRDPHIRIRFLGCRDVTDTALLGFSVNGQIATSIGTDDDADGNYDFSPLLVFRPLDPAAASTPADVLTGACTAVEPTTCSTGGATPLVTDATNTATGTCLSPIAGTTSGYTPGVTSPTDACFATSAGTLDLTLADIPITLTSTQVAAEYAGDPATGLVDGLLRGFISEAQADATVLPATLPLVGGKSLSSLLAGGTGNCATTSDKDVVDGVTGWWFYLNFTAQQVAWTE
jgi:hypothetical protein